MSKRRRGPTRPRIEPRLAALDARPAAALAAKPAARPVPSSKRPTRAKPAKPKPAKAIKRTKRAPSARPWPLRLAFFGLYWGTVGSLWGALAVVCLLAWHAAQLPSADTWAVPERAPNIRIADAAGRLVAHRGLGSAQLDLDQISPFLPQAVIAIEDRRFHDHLGFDPVGFARAMAANLAAGRLRQGGSTVTQQLAKNLFLSPERTFGRKMQELVLSFWLEHEFSKTQIMEMYLNRVWFGHGATGADAAARRYFGTSAARLNLQEAATLAGMLKAPSRLNPITSPERARARAELVLAAMERDGFITPAQRRRAARTPATAARGTRLAGGSTGWVADMVAAEVRDLLGHVDRDLDVTVTLDRNHQEAAHRAVSAALAAQKGRGRAREGALVALAPDGAVRALVGGRDYRHSQFNRAATAKRQPGSAFKPFLWAAALERGTSPLDTVADTPLQSGAYRPRNASAYRGEVTVAEALAVSSNVAAARMVRRVGARRLAQTARRMGVLSPLAPNDALALGASEVTPLELAGAYAPFANGGRRALPYLVSRIAERDGRVLYRREPMRGARVLDPAVAGEMAAMLAGAVREGTGRRARLERLVAAGKTGTTQGGRDAWFAGWAGVARPQLVAVAWFGNDDASPTRQTGGGIAARAWGLFMGEALEGRTIALEPSISRRGPTTVPTARPAS